MASDSFMAESVQEMSVNNCEQKRISKILTLRAVFADWGPYMYVYDSLVATKQPRAHVCVQVHMCVIYGYVGRQSRQCTLLIYTVCLVPSLFSHMDLDAVIDAYVRTHPRRTQLVRPLAPELEE